jgi:hypothetical protein
MVATMSKIKLLKSQGKDDVAQGLRNIADLYEAGELEGNCTLVVGLDVFHLGSVNAAQDAVWNLEFGKAKLINAALGV